MLPYQCGLILVSANDPKLSDGGARRGACMVGGKAAAEAGPPVDRLPLVPYSAASAVTCGAC